VKAVFGWFAPAAAIKPKNPLFAAAGESEIPKEKYENIFKGAYERPDKYVPKNKTRKVKKIYK
jgi:hypothetical protein